MLTRAQDHPVCVQEIIGRYWTIICVAYLHRVMQDGNYCHGIQAYRPL
jgi:hypothetical protein